MKNVLFVVDEKMMGGVSVMLENIMNMIDATNLKIDILVLHDRGDMLKNIPQNVNLIYGTKYFSTVDIPIKQVLKSKNIFAILNKIRLVFDMKTGLIKNRIKKERKKILTKHYDYEVAFKDGFTAIFTACGDSDVKYHWIQYDYRIGNPNAKYPKLFNEILPVFDKIISVSDGVANDFNNIYHLNSKVEVIDNLVDTKGIKRKALEKCDVITEKEKFNIICVGRLNNTTKGYDRLVNSIAKLKKEKNFENCVVRIYGDGEDREVLEQQIQDLDLKEEILLMGRVDNPYKYYKGNDLFVLTSYFEAFGLVIVEAMTCGIPAMVTKNSATSKLIKNNENGLIVDNSEEGIYEGLKDLISNNHKIKKFKKALEKYNYNNEEIIKKINKLFK